MDKFYQNHISILFLMVAAPSFISGSFFCDPILKAIALGSVIAAIKFKGKEY